MSLYDRLTKSGLAFGGENASVTAIMRQIGEKILTIATVVALIATSVPQALAASIVTTVVTDPLSGVAIEGYDPVSYFSEQAPLVGRPDYTFDWGGVPWYFANAANRDIFSRSPEVYAPQFGGHCAMSLARGFLSDGKAGIYVVTGKRLYLFYSLANRDAFMLARTETVARAGSRWPDLSRQLTSD